MDGEAAELPDPLREWVRQRASETGRTPEEVLARAAAVYRSLEAADAASGDDGLPIDGEETTNGVGHVADPAAVVAAGLREADPETLAAALDSETVAAAVDGETLAAAVDEETLVATLDEERLAAALDGVSTEDDGRTDALAERVAALESELDEKIEDVRSRVIQVKREADAKAPADHDHPALTEELSAVADRIDKLAETVEAADDRIAGVEERTATVAASTEELDDRLAATESRLDEGFDNYEEVLRRLDERTTELRERTDTLASSLSRHRDRVDSLSTADARREAVEDLQQTAAEAGVADANCGSCGTTVHVGLLAAPRCPHCEAPYDGIDDDTGLFRKPKLVVADRPALESPDDGGIDP